MKNKYALDTVEVVIKLQDYLFLKALMERFPETKLGTLKKIRQAVDLFNSIDKQVDTYLQDSMEESIRD